MNTTLVACYGPKAAGLSDFLSRLQNRLGEALGAAYAPYAPEQVHGTIVGLEGSRDGGCVINANYLQMHAERRAMDFAGVLDAVGESGLLPFSVRLGGYADGGPYPFVSRGRAPYERSFAIQGSLAVAMGWPVDGDRFPPALDRLRRAFNRWNVLHKYHSTPADVDNDFFLVLGRVDRARASEQAVRLIQDELRRSLSALDPLDIEIGRDSLSLVAYSDATLPWRRCRSYALAEARRKLAEIVALYDPVP